MRLLQWGRDQLIAETEGPKPRQVRAPASMGPRSIDRGNELLEWFTALGIELQWGRDQLIAETSGLQFQKA